MFNIAAYFKFLLVLLLISALPLSLLAEGNKADERPKIGLVLKGGGALGFAHVGVLRVLEELRVPIDYVAGTSIGSIVGAAYSSGTPVEEMQKIMSETDWNALFGEKIHRENIDFRLKGGRSRELYGEGKIGIKNGAPVIPRGVVVGSNIRILFQQMFGYPPSPVDFDSLPVPFRAVTADVETGEAYVPERGDLATVVRASMSIPGAFVPVEIDGKLLVDGGIANNMPVDVAINMGADILIVVDLISALATKDKLDSPLAVSGQVISLLLQQNSLISRARVRPQDVVIEPNVSDYTVSDFPKGLELMAIGEQAARVQTSELKKLALSEEEYKKYYTKRTTRISQPSSIDFIRINNHSNYPTEHIREKLKSKPGKPFNPEQLDRDINRVYQTGQFETVEYSVVTEDGQSGIEVNARGKGWFDQYLRLGLSLEDNLDGDARFRLGVAGRVNSITNKGSYLETAAEIGATPRLSGELYQLFSETSNYFINPVFSIGESLINVSSGGDIIAEYQRTEGLASLLVGRRITSLGETSIGATRGFGELSKKIGDPSLDEISYDIGDAFWRFELDSLDKVDFPTQGIRFSSTLNASVDELGASGGDYQDWTGALSWPISYGRNTLIVANRSLATFGERPIQRYQTLGGFLNISGSLQRSFPATDYSSTSLIFFRRLSEVDNPFFDIAAFLGGSYEATTLYSDDPRFESDSLIQSGSIFVGADTPLFPLYLAYGMADTGDHSFYIMLGRLNLNTN